MSKTTFITGASRGIGLGLSKALLERGDRVLAAARTIDNPGLQAVAAAHPETCRIVKLDLLAPEDNENAVKAAAELEEPIDWLIHNAGIFAPGEEGLARVNRQSMADVFMTNVIAPLDLTRVILPYLRQPGAIVAGLGSGAGVRPKERKGPGTQYSYGISKAALHAAAWHLEADLYPLGITSIILGPGFVRTDMTAGSSVRPPLSVEESVTGLLRALDAVTLEDSGDFIEAPAFL